MTEDSPKTETNFGGGPDGNIQESQTTTGKSKSFEDVLVAMGGPGQYETLQGVMIFTTILPTCFVYARYVFMALEPTHACSQGNSTEIILNNVFNMSTEDTKLYRTSYDKSCEIDIQKNESGRWKSIKTIGCIHGYDYDGGKDVSFVTEWDLVCDQTGIPQLAQSVIAIGSFIGTLIMSPIADRIGRWLTIVLSLLLTAATEFATAYAPDIYSLIIIRFFAGIVVSGMYISSYVLAIEMFVSNYRATVTALSGAMWAVCTVMLTIMAYILRDYSWREFQLYSTILCLFPFVFIYFINESASWLHSVGNKQRSENIIKKACKANGVKYDRVVEGTFEKCFYKSNETKKDSMVDKVKNKIKGYSVFDLFRYKDLLLIVVITWFSCMTQELLYTGLFLTASALVGNLYLNIGIVSIVGIPASALDYVLLKYTGRRTALIGWMAMTAICLLISTVVEHVDHNIIDEGLGGKISLAFFVLGKLANHAGYSVLVLYIPETFPTNLRSSGMGIATSGTSIGGALAPYLLPLKTIASWAPGTSLILCCTLTSILFFKLPETKGKQLATTLE